VLKDFSGAVQQNTYNISHLTLTLVPHYLGEIRRSIYHKNHVMCTRWSICRIHNGGWDNKSCCSCCWYIDELTEQLTDTWHNLEQSIIDSAIDEW